MSKTWLNTVKIKSYVLLLLGLLRYKAAHTTLQT